LDGTARNPPGGPASGQSHLNHSRQGRLEYATHRSPAVLWVWVNLLVAIVAWHLEESKGLTGALVAGLPRLSATFESAIILPAVESG
jgi:hypothetical protein